MVPGGYDWVDVRDVCQAALSAINSGKKGDNYILSGNWFSLQDMVKLINKVTGIGSKPFFCPEFLAKLALPYFYLQSKISGTLPLYTFETFNILKNNNRLISSMKAKNDLGYCPRPIEETISDTYHWFKSQNLVI